MITNSKLVVVEVSSSFTRWRHYFPKLIQINSGTMFRMKRLWFVPNWVKICSIFLKLYAVKKSFLTHSVVFVCKFHPELLSSSPERGHQTRKGGENKPFSSFKH